MKKMIVAMIFILMIVDNIFLRINVVLLKKENKNLFNQVTTCVDALKLFRERMESLTLSKHFTKIKLLQQENDVKVISTGKSIYGN